MRLRPIHLRALRDGLTVAGLLFAGYLFVIVAPARGTFGFDAYAYWSVDIDHPYRAAAGALGAFPYSPVAARAFAVVGGLPWLTFAWLWSAVLVGTVIWLGWRRALVVLAFPPVALELYHGNVHLLIAAAIALGFRYPAAWAIVLLTKVTPGVGLVWFAVRREWRSLAIALGVSAALAIVSLLVDGRLWTEWLRDSLSVTASASDVGQPHIDVPLAIRLPIAVVVVAWGAWSDRRWAVPLGAALATPILWLSAFSILAAIPALDRRGLAESDRAPAWTTR